MAPPPIEFIDNMRQIAEYDIIDYEGILLRICQMEFSVTGIGSADGLAGPNFAERECALSPLGVLRIEWGKSKAKCFTYRIKRPV